MMPDISRSKQVETMKFGQLIEYNMKNIFLKNNKQNVLEKLVPDPLKTKIECISGATV